MPEETIITPYRDGPLLVRGPFRLVDQDGTPIANEREVVALCRCGKSRIRPFCDGSHKIVRFRAPSGAERGREHPAGENRMGAAGENGTGAAGENRMGAAGENGTGAAGENGTGGAGKNGPGAANGRGETA